MHRAFNERPPRPRTSRGTPRRQYGTARPIAAIRGDEAKTSPTDTSTPRTTAPKTSDPHSDGKAYTVASSPPRRRRWDYDSDDGRPYAYESDTSYMVFESSKGRGTSINSTGLPYISLSVGPMIVTALLDSGSSICVVHPRIVPRDTPVHKDEANLCTASGQRMPSLGTVSLSLRVKDIEMTCRFRISPDLVEDMILGAPFLRGAQVSLDYANMRASLSRYQVICPFEESRTNPASQGISEEIACRLSETVALKPGQSVFAPIRLPKRSVGLPYGIFRPTDLGNGTKVHCTGLVDLRDEWARVPLINRGPFTILLRKGSIVGMAAPAPSAKSGPDVWDHPDLVGVCEVPLTSPPTVNTRVRHSSVDVPKSADLGPIRSHTRPPSRSEDNKALYMSGDRKPPEGNRRDKARQGDSLHESYPLAPLQAEEPLYIGGHPDLLRASKVTLTSPPPVNTRVRYRSVDVLGSGDLSSNRSHAWLSSQSEIDKSLYMSGDRKPPEGNRRDKTRRGDSLHESYPLATLREEGSHEKPPHTEGSAQTSIQLFEDTVWQAMKHRSPSEPGMPRLKELLSEYSPIFYKPGSKLPPTTLIVHEINLLDGSRPVFITRGQLAHAEKVEVERMIKELLRDGTIQWSTSPYSSPLVVVTKHDGSKRICNDFRGLNKITVPDRYLPSRADEIIAAFLGRSVFSKLDLKSGYYQIRVKEGDRHKTSFSVPGVGQFEYIRLPLWTHQCPSHFLPPHADGNGSDPKPDARRKGEVGYIRLHGRRHHR